MLSVFLLLYLLSNSKVVIIRWVGVGDIVLIVTSYAAEKTYINMEKWSAKHIKQIVSLFYEMFNSKYVFVEFILVCIYVRDFLIIYKEQKTLIIDISLDVRSQPFGKFRFIYKKYNFVLVRFNHNITASCDTVHVC